jgi:hypothetical protein
MILRASCPSWAALLAAALAAAIPAAAQQIDWPGVSCDPRLTALFTPGRPVLGRYEVCTDPRALSDLLGASDTVETMAPLDAFGAAGPYDRTVLARLYGGARVRVVHRWKMTPTRFESATLISPHPDARLTRLEPGTLVIRWTCRAHEGRCVEGGGDR